MYDYGIYGLQIKSEILIAQWNVAASDLPVSDSVPVTISINAVPQELPLIKSQAASFQSSPGDFLFQVNGIARYRVQRGCSISVQLLDKTHLADATLFITEPVMGALLHQRKIMVLHAAAVTRDNRATLLLGASGSGKSALTAGLVQSGWRFISDELSVIIQDGADYWVYPGNPKIGLWSDVLSSLKQDHLPDLEPVRLGLKKYWLDVRDHAVNKPIKLGHIINLQVHNLLAIEKQALGSQDRFKRLVSNTYMPMYLDGLGERRNQFQLLIRLANQIPITQVNHSGQAGALFNILDVIKGI